MHALTLIAAALIGIGFGIVAGALVDRGCASKIENLENEVTDLRHENERLRKGWAR